jgi:hypothetical protein
MIRKENFRRIVVSGQEWNLQNWTNKELTGHVKYGYMEIKEKHKG